MHYLPSCYIPAHIHIELSRLLTTSDTGRVVRFSTSSPLPERTSSSTPTVPLQRMTPATRLLMHISMYSHSFSLQNFSAISGSSNISVIVPQSAVISRITSSKSREKSRIPASVTNVSSPIFNSPVFALYTKSVFWLMRALKISSDCARVI